MKLLLFICLLLSFALSGCNGWTVRPIPYNLPSAPLPSQTPSIHTATPNILPPIVTVSLSESSLTPTSLSYMATPQVNPTFTGTPASPTIIPTLKTVPSDLLRIDLLGCNTSLDITHGMGEVTNAYIAISNLGVTDLENVCVTLRGQDEGRPHPDKIKCIPSLPGGFQVTLKLTIDTTYKKDSPIQVDITSNEILLQRLGKDGCTDISLFFPDIGDLGIVKRTP